MPGPCKIRLRPGWNSMAHKRLRGVLARSPSRPVHPGYSQGAAPPLSARKCGCPRGDDPVQVSAASLWAALGAAAARLWPFSRRAVIQDKALAVSRGRERAQAVWRLKGPRAARPSRARLRGTSTGGRRRGSFGGSAIRKQDPFCFFLVGGVTWDHGPRLWPKSAASSRLRAARAAAGGRWPSAARPDLKRPFCPTSLDHYPRTKSEDDASGPQDWSFGGGAKTSCVHSPPTAPSANPQWDVGVRPRSASIGSWIRCALAMSKFRQWASLTRSGFPGLALRYTGDARELAAR